ncbi:hypothetical protein [Rhodanobacter lindaniclasticus]
MAMVIQACGSDAHQYQATRRMNLALQLELDDLAEDGEDPAYLREQLIAYIGDKRALLRFMRQGIGRVKRRWQAEAGRARPVLGKPASSPVVEIPCASWSPTTWTYSETTNRCYLSNRAGRCRELDARLRELNALSPRTWYPA